MFGNAKPLAIIVGNHSFERAKNTDERDMYMPEKMCARRELVGIARWLAGSCVELCELPTPAHVNSTRIATDRYLQRLPGGEIIATSSRQPGLPTTATASRVVTVYTYMQPDVLPNEAPTQQSRVFLWWMFTAPA